MSTDKVLLLKKTIVDTNLSSSKYIDLYSSLLNIGDFTKYWRFDINISDIEFETNVPNGQLPPALLIYINKTPFNLLGYHTQGYIFSSSAASNTIIGSNESTFVLTNYYQLNGANSGFYYYTTYKSIIKSIDISAKLIYRGVDYSTSNLNISMVNENNWSCSLTRVFEINHIQTLSLGFIARSTTTSYQFKLNKATIQIVGYKII